jgi:hypothetical protein
VATARSLELQALAERLAGGVSPEIEEVLLTGSVSRGVADEDSDGELPERDGWWLGGTIEGEFFELAAWIRGLLRAGGRLELTKRLVDDLDNVLRIVFALNRAWEPGRKRLPELVAPLAVKPDRLAERVDEALVEVDIVAARRLVRDTRALAPDLPRVAQARELTSAILTELA